MPFKTTENWLLYDVIYSRVILIENFAFFNKQF